MLCLMAQKLFLYYRYLFRIRTYFGLFRSLPTVVFCEYVYEVCFTQPKLIFRSFTKYVFVTHTY